MYQYDHEYERECAMADQEERYDRTNLFWRTEEDPEEDEPEEDELAPVDDLVFADPGGKSALRAATRQNPRNLPCPTCGEPNRLTPVDRARGYQCDTCADRDEGTYVGADY